jgi:hypothetical protein
MYLTIIYVQHMNIHFLPVDLFISPIYGSDPSEKNMIEDEKKRRNQKTVYMPSLVKTLSSRYPYTATIFSMVSIQVSCEQFLTETWFGTLLKLPQHMGTCLSTWLV